MTKENEVLPNCGLAEISYGFKRCAGPRWHHGHVTLLFDGSQPYSFCSRAAWPATDNFDAEVRDGVEAGLMEILGGLSATKVELVSIEWDNIASCARDFRLAALIATRLAFSGEVATKKKPAE